jgi:hypothetical protein
VISRGAAIPSRLAVLVVVVLATITPAAGLAVGAPSVTGGDAPRPSVDGNASIPTAAVQPGSFDQAFRIEVYANGSTRWTFVYSRPLSNDTAEANFREYARRFRTNETDLYRDFRTRAQALTRRGTNETGRTMSAAAFRRDAYVGGPALNQGIVEMSFLWTGFAETDGDRVIVGDVFEGGLYVAADQRFVVTWGPELALVEATPEGSATPDSVTWTGGDEGRQFLDERPRVVLTRAATTTTAAATTTTTTVASGNRTTAPPAAPAGSGAFPAVVGMAVLLLGLGIAAADRSGTFDGAFGGTTTDGGSGDGGAAAADTADETLVSDEDRVVGLLEEKGGRMKQVNIVEETEWSKSKVSMLLSEMEEEGTISKLRVGRENIISLNGHEPELADSPFDDEE